MPYFGGFISISEGIDTPIEIGQGGIAGVLLGNESGYSVVVSIGGNYKRSLYPGTVDYYPIPSHQFSGIITITPYQKLDNVSSWPSSFIQVDIIGVNDQLHGTYPAPLVRNSNVGNSVNTVGGTASAIQNDANTAGTSIVESTVSGDGASAVSLTNDGVLRIGTSAHHGSVSLDNGAITSDGNGNFSANSLTSSKASGTGLAVKAASSLDNGNITSNGSGVLTTTSLICSVGGFTGVSGDQLARLGNSGGTGTGTFNHTLGAIPDWAGITTHVNGSQTVGYNAETSTQFHVTAGAGLAWFAILTKRS